MSEFEIKLKKTLFFVEPMTVQSLSKSKYL